MSSPFDRWGNRHKAVQSNFPGIGIDHTEITEGEHPKSISSILRREHWEPKTVFMCVRVCETGHLAVWGTRRW